MRLIRALISLAACAALAQAPVALSAADMWDFNPPPDEFSPKAAFDLRSLNEKVAGEHGFIKKTADGDGFLTGDGQPIRFWAMNITVGPEKDEDLAHFAHFLAKRGVNMARLFLNLYPDEKKAHNAPAEATNMSQVERCQQAVAALKKEGIYSIISPFWPTPKYSDP